jgi:hypothetical protein
MKRWIQLPRWSALAKDYLQLQKTMMIIRHQRRAVAGPRRQELSTFYMLHKPKLEVSSNRVTLSDNGGGLADI